MYIRIQVPVKFIDSPRDRAGIMKFKFNLKIIQREVGDVRVLDCEGHLDSTTYKYASDIVKRLLEADVSKLVFNLKEIEYISSSGWAIFIGNLAMAQNKGGDIKLAAMSENVKYTFGVLDLEHILKSYDTVDKALESFKY